METSCPVDYLPEESRIRAAYDRRRQRQRYSHFSPDYLFALQRREAAVLELLRRCGYADRLEHARVFEVGCGEGYWLRELVKWGARPEHLAGIDLLPERIAAARRLSPGEIRFHCGSAASLPYGDERFDLLLQGTVFTSILDRSLKQKIAGEMLRLLKPGGFVLWYDFRVNNPRNSDVRGVGGREIRSLFPGCRIRLKPVTLAPPLARRLVPYSRIASCLLEAIPFLCTHYLGVFQKLPQPTPRATAVPRPAMAKRGAIVARDADRRVDP